MKKVEVNLNMICVNVEPRIIKTNTTLVIGEPLFDIHEEAALHMGTTRDEYRRTMNSEEGYKKLIEYTEG